MPKKITHRNKYGADPVALNLSSVLRKAAKQACTTYDQAKHYYGEYPENLHLTHSQASTLDESIRRDSTGYQRDMESFKKAIALHL